MLTESMYIYMYICTFELIKYRFDIRNQVKICFFHSMFYILYIHSSLKIMYKHAYPTM